MSEAGRGHCNCYNEENALSRRLNDQNVTPRWRPSTAEGTRQVLHILDRSLPFCVKLRECFSP